MSKIPDISTTEEWIVGTTLKERYGRDVDLQFADAFEQGLQRDHQVAGRNT